MTTVNPTIEPSWKAQLADEFNAEYFTQLKAFLLTER